MKLSYIVLISLFTTTFTTSVAQSIKVKKDKVYVDGVLFLKIQCTIPKTQYLVRVPGKYKPIVKVEYVTFNNPQRATKCNCKGAVNYVELHFLGTDIVAEVGRSWQEDKSRITRLLLEYRLIKNRALDVKNARGFAELMGHKYRDERHWIQSMD